MKQKNTVFISIGILAIIFVSFIALNNHGALKRSTQLDSVPTNVTLSGTYVCLPYLDKTRTAPEECVFGLLTDDGVYYMVNFGQSATAKEQFDKQAHITAKGFVVPKETLSTDHWAPYDMEGIFTITERL